jgi:hypothetical protein
MTTATATTAPTPEQAAARAALADGLGELAAAVDHDLRDRLRGLQREAEAWLAGHDPATDWPAFEGWLGERARAEIVDNHRLLRDGARRLATDAGVAVDLTMAPPSPPKAESLLTPTRPAGTELGLTAVRGACGGVITAGLLGNLAGLAVAGPAAIAVGLAFGVKSYRDDRARHLTNRRTEARVVVQRYVDEVVFQCANASRASLREVQRRFRGALAGGPQAIAPAGDDRTVALAPVRRTVEQPPVTIVQRRRRGRVLVAVAAAVAVAAIAGLSLRNQAPATASAPPASAPDDAGAFVANLVAATRDGDVDALLGRLHPAVLARYGVDACRYYLAGAGALPLDVVVRETTSTATWDWASDGVSERIADVALVEVSRVVDSETVVQELHFARVDGALRWFTDCGDPISR